MRTFPKLAAVAALALAAGGCNESSSPAEEVQRATMDVGDRGAPVTQFGFMEAAQPTIGSGSDAARIAASGAKSAARGESDAAVGAQIAYSYSYGFRVDADNLPGLQQRHRALCEAMGSDCRVLSLAQSGNDEFGYGEMELQVAAARAEEFGAQLTAATDGIDAEQVSFGISGEDLTDDIIDTEARLEGRRVLRDRLMDVLRTRQGSVGDLVEAERGVAAVNEEIDSATQRLENMRNRVAYGSVSIIYDPQMGEYRLGFARPIVEAFGSVGTTLGVVIAAIIYIAVALIPIAAFLLLLRWVWRKSGLRIRRAKKAGNEE